MARAPEPRRELPPTAGLPLAWRDLLPWGDADLEGALARWLGVEGTQLECSGTAAFIIALRTLHARAPQRDEVVVPAYTCPLVALAVAHCGLRLVLCDVAPASTDLDLEQLRTLCSPRTLAVVPTHLCGRVADVAGPLAIARAHGAWVIEDAAQALGARVGAGPVGLQGDIGFFSLAAGKGLTLYEGGVLVTRDAGLRAALRATSARIVPRSLAWELRRSVELLGYAVFYHPSRLRWVYGRPVRAALAQGDWVAAAGDDFDADIPLHRVGRWRHRVGARALPRLARCLDAARQHWRELQERLGDMPGVQVLGDSARVPDALGVRPVTLLRLPGRAARDRALHSLWPAGLGVSLPFVQPLQAYGRYAGVVPAGVATPHAQDLADRVLAVGNSAWRTPADLERIVDALASALRAE